MDLSNTTAYFLKLCLLRRQWRALASKVEVTTFCNHRRDTPSLWLYLLVRRSPHTQRGDITQGHEHQEGGVIETILQFAHHKELYVQIRDITYTRPHSR